MPTDAFFERLANNCAYATDTRDMGEHGVLLTLPGGVKWHLTADMWRDFRAWQAQSPSDAQAR